MTDDSGFALYFSRAPIPYVRSADSSAAAREAALHHHGIYAYRNEILQTFVSTAQSRLEVLEQLEQLRALSSGMRIKVGVPDERPGPGVDTEADLALVARLLG